MKKVVATVELTAMIDDSIKEEDINYEIYKMIDNENIEIDMIVHTEGD